MLTIGWIGHCLLTCPAVAPAFLSRFGAAWPVHWVRVRRHRTDLERGPERAVRAAGAVGQPREIAV